MNVVGLVLTFAAMVGISFLLLGGVRRRGYVPKTWRGVRSLRMPEAVAGFPAGIIAAVAMVNVLQLFDVNDALVTGLCGVSVGIASVVAGRSVPIFFEVLGLGAIVATLWGVVTAADCDGASDLSRAWIAAGLTLIGIVAYVIVSFFFARSRTRVGFLAAFALLDIVVFIEAPLGVPLVTQSSGYAILAVVVALAFGAGAAVFPGVVLGLGALGVSLASFGVGAGYGAVCSADGVWSPVVAIAAFCGVYLVGSAVRRRVV